MKKSQIGQTLIEVLVALSVISIIVTSITIAVITSLNNAEFVKNQNLATEYAQQGMEEIRFMRNTNYTSFTGLNGQYCLKDTCTQIVPSSQDCGTLGGNNCGSNVSTIFDREVDVYSGNVVQNPCKYGTSVTSTVSWADNKCTNRNNPYCHVVKLATCFTAGDVILGPT